MNPSISFRELPAGSAWNEAVRRAMAISIAGYFVPNLLASFGVIPQLDESFKFMPGVCGAAGVFSMAVSLFIGQYHRRLPQGLAFGLAGLILPYFVTWLWFRTTNPSASAGLLQLCLPAVVVEIGTFVALMLWHARLSNVTVNSLGDQLENDEYGKPKARWEKAIYWTFLVVGSILILVLVLGSVRQH
jgi:energy-coupling factor transporter transmembrane protein EcfT